MEKAKTLVWVIEQRESFSAKLEAARKSLGVMEVN